MEYKKEKIITSDGSHTLFMPEINEYYHSHHGAIQEAKHVFIKNGLNHLDFDKEISILEIGFGTGLNALLTCLEAKNKVNYLGIEAFPLIQSDYENLNFVEQIDKEKAKSIFSSIHDSNWEDFVEITDKFRLKKIKNTLQNFSLEENSIDLIYFDAFGPRAQAEMWIEEIFSKLYSFLKTGGIFVTYCAKGQVKRDLKSVGFELETLPGPPGKREMIRCTKK
jgi:tRNA U34 5-methylaminomethyl-2-thiouridine-forming methyltransferase MnmC